jgi:hypothetical protein
MSITMDSAIPGLGDALAVMCSNQMAGPTIIAGDAHRNYETIFAGKGDPDGNDVQPIPEALLRTIAFQKALRQGILLVVEGEDHPVVQQAMQRQTDSFRKRMASQDQAARESIDAPSEDDILVVTCIGPGTSDGSACGDQVPVKSRDAASRPPLCDRHRQLSDRCLKRGDGPWVLEDDGI